ncbi:MAG: hypothetical protein M0P11_08255 [Anaerolineaceae bacterium]|nr:hypothetical protein [Anaerolineaceae bacterium]
MMTDLTQFEESHRHIYISALLEMAHSDGHADERELAYIDLQANLAGIEMHTFNDPLQDVSDYQLASLPSMLRNLLLRDAITLAYIDEDYTETEQAKLYELADRMAISRDKITEIENWLLDYWLLMEKGEELFS